PPRKGVITTSANTAATPATLTGRGAARNFWRRRSIRSRATCVACPDPSLGGMSLPRAHPCIAHYRPFTGGTQSDTTFGNGGGGGGTPTPAPAGPPGRGGPAARGTGGGGRAA